MPTTTRQQMNGRTTSAAGTAGNPTTSHGARRRRREDSPEPPHVLPSNRLPDDQHPTVDHSRRQRRPPIWLDDENEGDQQFHDPEQQPARRRPRRERRAPARFDDEDEGDQHLRSPPRPPRPPRPIKCAFCDESFPREHFEANGELYDTCIECRRTIPPSRIPFTDNVDTPAIPQHAINCIKTFQSECEKITVDTCITCNERWFGLDVSREGRCKRCRSSYLRRTKFTDYNNMDPGEIHHVSKRLFTHHPSPF